ncbi:hypothetical protein LNAOJCKE_5079 [Methylorubrum aminovorans]|uniref:Uncharacterized protein n=1 Tax=Methylorubrum aminovorans TaxID=269069 RepID=A0ABQ4UKI8_9HYPH|nr:hypothetical protein [Methylorubrum aminovorans]GJE67846.1 hypothetical protein LNAOJCKE_5079 [Methylorubrum aminovorans]GMA74887.1 hypothetical protein GCM10025880_13040 [Methylorubrum aminovorans]
MIWATRLITEEEVASFERLFTDQAEAFDPNDQMLLVSVKADWPGVRLWVGVPDDDLLSSYYGFQPCKRSELPIAPTLVRGSATRFSRMFHGH